MEKYKILVIEDEEGIREGIGLILSGNFDVELAVNGVDGLKKAIRRRPHIILLDLKMPEMDGFQFCKSIREDREFDNVPIIVISAFNNPAERTKVFELGADDYISKPFDKSELLARISRKIQRTTEVHNHTSASDDMLVRGELQIDLKRQQVHIEGDPLILSAIEFKLMHLLAKNYDQLVSRQDIVDWVWEKQPVSPRLVDPHILSLRNKLNEVHFTVQSVYGKGYILKRL